MTTIPVYADATDLAAWTGATAPSNATTLLRYASALVRDATATVLYTVDSSNLPTDPAVLLAFQEATCAHADAMATAGVDPRSAGTVAGIGSTAIGSANVTYAGAQQAADARQALLKQLCPEAEMILRSAGLLTNPPLAYRG